MLGRLDAADSDPGQDEFDGQTWNARTGESQQHLGERGGAGDEHVRGATSIALVASRDADHRSRERAMDNLGATVGPLLGRLLGAVSAFELDRRIYPGIR